MLTLESGIGSARRRRAGDLRQLLRVDRSGRRPGTLAGRARRACGLHPSRWRGHGSFRRMDHGRHGRRRQFHGGGDRRPTRRYASDCADAQRSSAVRLNGFLPPLERRRRRGRHHAGNHRPGLYDGRRSCRGHSASAEERLLRGNHSRRHRPDGRAHDRALIDMHGVSRNRLRGGERLGRGRGHGAGYAAIDVVYVRYIDGLVVDDGGVVDIVDDRRVHCGVRDVDVIHIAPAHRIRGDVDLPRSKGKPGDPCADANPGDERRRVDRTYVDRAECPRRARHPPPGSSHRNPSTIVKRGKSPALIIDPGVSPRLDVRPMAVMIGSPAWLHSAREPHVAVIRRGLPRTLAIEILIAHDIGRHIARGVGVVPTAVSALTPRIERIRLRAVGLRIFNEFIGAGKDVVLVGINRIRAAGAGDFALAAAHVDGGGGACFIDSDAVHARLQDGERQIRRVDFVSLIVVEPADPNQQGPHRQLNLGDVIA